MIVKRDIDHEDIMTIKELSKLKDIVTVKEISIMKEIVIIKNIVIISINNKKIRICKMM